MYAMRIFFVALLLLSASFAVLTVDHEMVDTVLMLRRELVLERAIGNSTCPLAQCNAKLNETCTMEVDCIENGGDCSRLCERNLVCARHNGTNKCVDTFAGVPCSADRDCSANEYFTTFAQYKFFDFLADLFIQDQFKCVANVCTKQPGPLGLGDTCTSNADCYSNICTGGVCGALPNFAQCTEDNACAANSSCFEVFGNGTKYCAEPMLTVGQTCTTDDSCVEGLVCNKGENKCIPTFSGNASTTCDASLRFLVNVPLSNAVDQVCAHGYMCIPDGGSCGTLPCNGTCTAVPAMTDGASCAKSFVNGPAGGCNAFQTCTCGYATGQATCRSFQEHCFRFVPQFEQCLKSRGCVHSQAFVKGTCANGCLNDPSLGKPFFDCILSAVGQRFTNVTSCALSESQLPGVTSSSSPAATLRAVVALWF